MKRAMSIAGDCTPVTRYTPFVPQRVLITGGAGFIGSHLADALLAAGHTVGILDSFRTGRRSYLPDQVALYEVDLTDSTAVHEALADFRPQVVSHHAGQINVRSSLESPQEDAAINILGSLILLEAAVQTGVEHLTFSSTGGALYGDDVERPTPESAPTTPLSPYGIAKLAVEEYFRVLGPLHGLPVTVFRYANVYGPRQIVEGEAGVIAIFCERLRDGLTPVIYGDGEQTRDYIHVADIVSANQAAIERRVTGVFNLGTGIATSLTDLARQLETLSGAATSATHGPARPGEIRHSCLDARRACAALSWEPVVPLAAGLAETWRWFQSRATR